MSTTTVPATQTSEVELIVPPPPYRTQLLVLPGSSRSTSFASTQNQAEVGVLSPLRARPSSMVTDESGMMYQDPEGVFHRRYLDGGRIAMGVFAICLVVVITIVAVLH